ncbi:MAG: hypothetical protein HFJ52_07470 [Clostridia bacterium]|nr:hypothetical protein [Clostridia bacterium]
MVQCCLKELVPLTLLGGPWWEENFCPNHCGWRAPIYKRDYRCSLCDGYGIIAINCEHGYTYGKEHCIHSKDKQHDN